MACGILVTFDGEELPHVVGVQPQSRISRDQTIDIASLKGYRRRTLSVRGYIRKAPKLEMAELQAVVEKTFTEKGEKLLSYPGIDDYLARLTEWQWEEWTNGPLIFYTANFETAEDNPFSEDVTVTQTGVGSSMKTFSPRPNVADSFKSVDPVDEAVSPVREKEITLQGILRGTPAEIDAEETEIKELFTDDQIFSVTIPSGAYTCRCAAFDFGTPAGLDEGGSKTYTIKLITLPDFTLEGRALQGGPVTIAGITVDVASSFSHNVARDKVGVVTSESINVSGKNQFLSPALAEGFKTSVDTLVNSGTTTISPATGKTLIVTNVSWSEVVRDGHFPSGQKRYALKFSLGLAIDPSSEIAPGAASGIVLGVLFDVLENKTISVSIDDDGFVTTTSKSGSGKVSGDPAVLPGDSVIEDGKTFIVTSLTLGSFDDVGRRQVTVNGTTLDPSAAEMLFAQLFEGFMLDHVQSQQKSVSFQFDECTDRYKATSISASISGFKIGSDGNVLGLINAFDRFPDTFIITNVSTGAPEKVTRSGVIQLRYPISISGTLNLTNDIGACNEEPAIKLESSRTIQDSVAKFAQIPIPGRGIIFKKVGVTPAFETVVLRRVAKDRAAFNSPSFTFPADPTPTIGPIPKLIERSTSEAGLVKSVTVKFQAFTEGDQI